MNTYKYSIENTKNGFAVREQDSKSAKGCGEYSTWAEAKAAVDGVAGKCLSYDSFLVDDSQDMYWEMESFQK